jgi:glutaredoxin
MAEVTLYTRRGCHLCDDAKAALERVRHDHPFDLAIVDVDSDPALAARYGLEVPVILVDGRKHAKYRLDERAFVRRLALPSGEAPPEAE